jgi:hypothetical protein
MAGSPRNIKLNGRAFGLAADLEPKIQVGGRYIAEVVAYGDGIHVPLELEQTGKITDLQVRLKAENGDHEAFDALAKQKEISIVYNGSMSSYQGVGVIVAGTEGLFKNDNKDNSETFSLVATIGKFTRI